MLYHFTLHIIQLDYNMRRIEERAHYCELGCKTNFSNKTFDKTSSNVITCIQWSDYKVFSPYSMMIWKLPIQDIIKLDIDLDYLITPGCWIAGLIAWDTSTLYITFLCTMTASKTIEGSHVDKASRSGGYSGIQQAVTYSFLAPQNVQHIFIW